MREFFLKKTELYHKEKFVTVLLRFFIDLVFNDYEVKRSGNETKNQSLSNELITEIDESNNI